MKELIPHDEYGIFVDKEETVRVDSRFVSKFFEKRHKNVLRDIERLTDSDSGLSKEFTQLSFEPSSYKDSTGRKLPCYLLSRDGFTMLVMGYTGKKALQFKELYIRRFNEMEAQLKFYTSARAESPELAELVAAIHDEPKPYHFSNEYNMINRIALGMDAKHYRAAHGIPEGESIRPYLSAAEIFVVTRLQNVDIVYLDEGYDFQTRKEKLIAYRDKLLQSKKVKALM